MDGQLVPSSFRSFALFRWCGYHVRLWLAAMSQLCCMRAPSASLLAPLVPAGPKAMLNGIACELRCAATPPTEAFHRTVKLDGLEIFYESDKRI